MEIGYCLSGSDYLNNLLELTINNSSYQITSAHTQIGKEPLQLGKRKLFIHTSHSVNLSNESTYLRSLIRDLELGKNLGCSGVVVHVGKSLITTSKIGINQMAIAINKVLDMASIKCPLLLETPAGQGTELLVDIDSFIRFYKKYRQDNFKICIDTCHVFAAGYDPFIYILQIEKELGKDSIGLIHYNDSKEPLGSRIDRHRQIGQGCIPLDSLKQVASWAQKNQISILREN